MISCQCLGLSCCRHSATSLFEDIINAIVIMESRYVIHHDLMPLILHDRLLIHFREYPWSQGIQLRTKHYLLIVPLCIVTVPN